MTGALAVLIWLVAPPGLIAQSCGGDCSGDGMVSVAEVIASVNVALGMTAVDRCPASDGDRDGKVTIDELVRAVGGSVSGCPKREGRGAVEDAVRVATTTAEALPKFGVISFGSLRASGSANSTGQRRPLDMGAAKAAGMGAGQEPIACSGGTATVRCVNAGDGSSMREVVYSNCSTQEDGVSVTRDGIVRRTVSVPDCPIPPPPGETVTLQLEGYRETRLLVAAELSALIVDDVLTARFEPAGSTCESGDEVFRDGEMTINGTLRSTCNPTTDQSCDASLQDLLLTARGLVFHQTHLEPDCDITIDVEGQLVVDNELKGERFAETFLDFRFSQRIVNGERRLTESGRVFVDCIGEITYGTDRPSELVFDDTSACPTRGLLEIALGSALTAPAPIVGSLAHPSNAGGGAQASSGSGGLSEVAYRAANGQVYQVLRNPSGDPELATEDVQITSLVGSLNGVLTCSNLSQSEDPTAVVAARAGNAFPIDQVRVFGPILNATEPCFNPNANDGNGLVCIGPACGVDCRCPDGGCATFSFEAGLLVTSSGVGGRLVGLAAPSGVCSGFEGQASYAFGSSTPTLETEICDPTPTDGLSLESERTLIFAYDAPFSRGFFVGSAGFAINADNLGSCPANTVVSGTARVDALGPARVSFSDGAVMFDANADGESDRVLSSCQDLSIAECGAPLPSPTPTPVTPPACPEITAFNPPATGSTSDAFNAVGGASCGDGGNSAPERSFRFRPATTGCYRIHTLDTVGLDHPFDTLLYVRRGGQNCRGEELACNDSLDAQRLQSEVLAELQTGEDVVIVVDGSAGATGDFRLAVEQASDCPRPTTPTPTETAVSPSPTPSTTRSPSPSASPSSSVSRTSTVAPSATFTDGATSSPTPSATQSLEPTQSSTATASPTLTPTAPFTPTRTPTPTRTDGPSPTPGQLDGFVCEDRVWRLADSPIIVRESVIVGGVCPQGQKSITLTIQEGVEVRFEEDKFIQVNATLVAMGTSGSPILFNSNSSPGDQTYWNGIRFTDLTQDAVFHPDGTYASGSLLRHATIAFAKSNTTSGIGVVHLAASAPYLDSVTVRDSISSPNADDGEMFSLVGSPQRQVRIRGAMAEGNRGTGLQILSTDPVEVSDSAFVNNSSDGIYVIRANGPIDFRGVTSSGNMRGLYFFDTSVTIENSAVVGNQFAGIFDESGRPLTLTNTIVADNGGEGIQKTYGSSLTAMGNCIAGNGGGGLLGIAGEFHLNTFVDNVVVLPLGVAFTENNLVSDGLCFAMSSPSSTEFLGATNNWWGGTGASFISAKINDCSDTDLACVVFNPPAMGPIPGAPDIKACRNGILTPTKPW